MNLITFTQWERGRTEFQGQASQPQCHALISPLHTWLKTHLLHKADSKTTPASATPVPSVHTPLALSWAFQHICLPWAVKTIFPGIFPLKSTLPLFSLPA